jgi:regulator of protease activity HflC (stomatin/prohibitin superfamily)
MTGLVYLIVGIALVIFFLAGIRIVRPNEKAVVETLGKYSHFANLGFNWIFPVIQDCYIVNTTERMSQIETQEIITEDKLNAMVDLVVFHKVKKDEASVKASLYEVDDYKRQIVTLAQTTARNVIGGMLFKDVNAKRNELNKKLAEIMSKETKSWGVEIVRVELKEIIPPKDVQMTMNKVLIAENEKRSSIDFATAKETVADGERRAEIKKAEGEKQATILKAEGQAKAFKMINDSFKGNAIKLKNLEVTQASLQNNSKIIVTEKGISPQLIIGKLDTQK